jgi:MHS family proline/betaine transporter-like MFS transporter
MSALSSLSFKEKEAWGILQIGTFLEYFDLYLYIHMAVIMNELFFPQTDPTTAALISSFAFCSTFVFRPIGALLFGWMGDHIGRKSTIIITTVIMAMSCMVMANVPTYAQIGIASAWIVTCCRIAQGMSSMGEIVGAEIYLTETLRAKNKKASYFAVASLNTSCALGALAALGISCLVTSYLFNWRLAFYMGAFIAVIGAFARTRLRETPAFLKLQRQKLDAQRRRFNLYGEPIKGAVWNDTWKEPIRYKTLVAYFLIQSGAPLTFYICFIFFNPFLIQKFGFSSQDIIKNNFFLSFFSVAQSIFWTSLCLKYNPLDIVKNKGRMVLLIMLALPFAVANVTHPFQFFIIQCFLAFFTLGSHPSDAVLYWHLPLYKRFTLSSFIFASTRAVIYIITSFGLVYISQYTGAYGTWFITLPVAIGYLYGVSYFEKLELYANHPDLHPNNELRMKALEDEKREDGLL